MTETKKDSTLNTKEQTLKKALELDSLTMLKNIYAEAKKLDENAVCPSCNGKPFKGETCPICLKGSYEFEKVSIQEVNTDKMKELSIPEYYIGKDFNPNILKDEYKELNGREDFNTYLNVMDKVLSILSKGSLPKLSLYISAPSGFGKMTFVYNALQVAKNCGLTVAPYIDLLEAKMLIEACEDYKKPQDIIKDLGFRDTVLYKSDVCFIKVPPTIDSVMNIQTLLKIMDRRARRGLATIIISRYSFKYFTSYDYSNEFGGLRNTNYVSPKTLQVYDLHYKREKE